MARYSVEAVFKAIDRVTAPVTRMQNSIGKLTRSAELGLRRLRKTTASLNKGLMTTAKIGGGIFAAGAGIAATAINKVAGAADNLAKRTRAIQFPIEEFQEWSFVAQQSGFSDGEFEKGIGNFTKVLGEAKAGAGALTSILKKSNPELLEQLKNANNSAEGFETFVAGLRGIEDASVRAAVARAAFGRSGLKLLNITEQNTEALAALRKEARANGVITADQAANAEAFNDSVGSLTASLMSMLNEAILPMLPEITEMIKGWREWAIENRELIATKIQDFMRMMIEGIKRLIASVSEFDSKYNIADKIAAGFDTFMAFAGFLADNAGWIATITGAVGAFVAIAGVLVTVLTAVNLVLAANPIVLIVLGIMAAVAAVALLIKYLVDLADKFNVVGKVKDLIGFGEDEELPEENPSTGTQSGPMISPQARAAQLMQETRETSSAEVTIRDETGRGEVTKGSLAPNIRLAQSGAF